MAGPYAGHYLDGRTAARRRATIRLLGSILSIDLDDGRTLMWPVAEVRQTQGAYAGEQVRLERGAELPEVLLVDDRALLSELRLAGSGPHVRAPPSPRERIMLTRLPGLAGVGPPGALYRRGSPPARA